MKDKLPRFLLAPWRWDFISSGVEEKGCIFCNALKKNDQEALIVYRGRDFFLILNKFPYSSGHLMLVPNEHLSSPLDLKRGQDEFFQLQNLALESLKNAFHPDGFNLGMNLGQAAGAGVRDHFHLHIVPRWQGDANFMAVIGETRVVSFDLTRIYQQLKLKIEQLKLRGNG